MKIKKKVRGGQTQRSRFCLFFLYPCHTAQHLQLIPSFGSNVRNCSLSLLFRFSRKEHTHDIRRRKEQEIRRQERRKSMGLKYRDYLEGRKVYGCSHCRSHLSTSDKIMSKASAHAQCPVPMPVPVPMPMHPVICLFLPLETHPKDIGLSRSARPSVSVPTSVCFHSWLLYQTTQTHTT